MIVHDMRSRLFILLVGLELLEAKELKNIVEPNRKVLSQSLSATRMLIGMVDSLLDISKMESGEMRLKLSEHDLTDTARKVVSEYELQRGNRRFIIDAPQEPVKVNCDVDLIGRVIQNLFSNALKFTRSDGTITVKIQHAKDGVKVSVQDNGSGIPPQHVPKIFDKFYQVEARGPSAGLGLTFCKLAVELHGGRIQVDSEVVKGTTFWFILPSVAE
jgi:signal transduction histidine kinase